MGSFQVELTVTPQVKSTPKNTLTRSGKQNRKIDLIRQTLRKTKMA